MPSTMRLISKQTLGSDTGTVTFSNIPQTYTDLYLVVSGRSTRTTGSNSGVYLAFNGSSSNFSYRYINGTGSAAGSGSGSTNFAGVIGQDTDTANTFSQYVLYLPNYTGSTNKSMSIEAVQETNATAAWLSAWAVLWSNTAAVTSLSLSVEAGAVSWKSGSTFFLYGITGAAGSIPGTFGVDATGGAVTISGGFKYHVFRSSGVLTVAQPGWVEVLVVGGGGGAAYGRTGTYFGVPGGAGQVQAFSPFLSPSAYVVAVGAGGAGAGSTLDVNGSGGSTSSLGSLVSNGGGGGLFSTGVGGSSGNGFTGGSPNSANTGGGGGATANGANATAGGGGAGGAGTSAYSLWGAATGTGQNVGGTRWYGGGGGGTTSGAGGNGGGGASKAAGSANTGGGAGGGEYASFPALAGGSGIVIVRYPVT